MDNSNNKKDRFNDLIKSKLENYSLPSENISWDDLEKRLSAKETPKKQAFWPWISSLSVAASIAMVWFLYPLINKNIIKNEHTQLSSNEEKIPESAFSDASVPFDCVPNKENGSKYLGQKTKEDDTQLPPATRFDLIPSNIKLAIKPKIINSQKKRLIAVTAFDKYLSYSAYDPIVRKKQSSLGLHFSSGGLFAQNPSPISGSLRSSPISQNPLLREDILTPNDFNRKIYRPPFSFGLSVRKELNRTFSIESGLVYTYLSTIFENPYPYQEAFLDLHYLGIPLNLITNIYGNHYTRWNVYFLLGGTIEKGLLLQYKQRAYDDKPSVITIARSNEKIERLQTSLQSSFGLDYKFVNNYSVYLEPGLRYYLANNQPFNIRTEFPLVLNLNIGLRYNW